jgi:hypothetical protein
MTIWAIYFKDTNQGAYAAAPSCGDAKRAFQAAYGEDHPVRARHIKNVDKALFPSTTVLSPGDPRLAALSLRYEDAGQ